MAVPPELSLGRAVLRTGESGSVPITINDAVGVSNLSFFLFVATDRLANLGISGLAPELNSGTLQPVGPGLSKISFATGQTLQDGRVAQLNFTAISAHSAFVSLVISNVIASGSDGIPVTTTVTGTGRVVVVVAEEPLLEVLSLTNFPT